MTIASAIFLIAVGAGLALSLLYELVKQGGDSRDDRDEYSQRRGGGYDDPTRRL